MRVLFLSDFVPKQNLILDSSFIELLQGVDKVVFNLEGSPLTNTSHDSDDQVMPFCFSELLSFFENFGKDKFILALANNHILDNGKVGFDFLIEQLDQHGISYFGVKDKPFIDVGQELSILNFVTAETVAKYSSKERLNYIFYDPGKVNEQIKSLEDQDRELILYPHWGRDMDRTIFDTYNFKASTEEWFILGHHPHVISGIFDRYIYSLGNTFIPHPYYYTRYPAMRYGLAVIYEYGSKSLGKKLTKVKSEDNYRNHFLLEVTDFDSIPSVVLKQGEEYSAIKKCYKNFFAFRGNKFDLLRLIGLQVMSSIFDIRAKYLKN